MPLWSIRIERLGRWYVDLVPYQSILQIIRSPSSCFNGTNISSLIRFSHYGLSFLQEWFDNNALHHFGRIQLHYGRYCSSSPNSGGCYSSDDIIIILNRRHSSVSLLDPGGYRPPSFTFRIFLTHDWFTYRYCILMYVHAVFHFFKFWSNIHLIMQSSPTHLYCYRNREGTIIL